MSEPRPCRKCGMLIEFIVGPNEKTIPAQRVRTVYLRTGDALVRAKLVAADETTRVEQVGGVAYVSHFETCPHASEFSKGAT